MMGCAGSVTFANRATLCPSGSYVCEAQDWMNYRSGDSSTYNYWTNDNLRYNGSSSACFVSETVGTVCAHPMRVCTPS